MSLSRARLRWLVVLVLAGVACFASRFSLVPACARVGRFEAREVLGPQIQKKVFRHGIGI